MLRKLGKSDVMLSLMERKVDTGWGVVVNLVVKRSLVFGKRSEKGQFNANMLVNVGNANEQ